MASHAPGKGNFTPGATSIARDAGIVVAGYGFSHLQPDRTSCKTNSTSSERAVVLQGTCEAMDGLARAAMDGAFAVP